MKITKKQLIKLIKEQSDIKYSPESFVHGASEDMFQDKLLLLIRQYYPIYPSKRGEMITKIILNLLFNGKTIDSNKTDKINNYINKIFNKTTS